MNTISLFEIARAPDGTEAQSDFPASSPDRAAALNRSPFCLTEIGLYSGEKKMIASLPAPYPVSLCLGPRTTVKVPALCPSLRATLLSTEGALSGKGTENPEIPGPGCFLTHTAAKWGRPACLERFISCSSIKHEATDILESQMAEQGGPQRPGGCMGQESRHYPGKVARGWELNLSPSRSIISQRGRTAESSQEPFCLIQASPLQLFGYCGQDTFPSEGLSCAL